MFGFLCYLVGPVARLTNTLLVHKQSLTSSVVELRRRDDGRDESRRPASSTIQSSAGVELWIVHSVEIIMMTVVVIWPPFASDQWFRQCGCQIPWPTRVKISVTCMNSQAPMALQARPSKLGRALDNSTVALLGLWARREFPRFWALTNFVILVRARASRSTRKGRERMAPHLTTTRLLSRSPTELSSLPGPRLAACRLRRDSRIGGAYQFYVRRWVRSFARHAALSQLPAFALSSVRLEFRRSGTSSMEILHPRPSILRRNSITRWWCPRASTAKTPNGRKSRGSQSQFAAPEGRWCSVSQAWTS